MTLEMLNVHDCSSLKTITNLPNLLTSLHVDMKGCPVVEVQGMFKLQPIGNVDEEIINEMGLSSELENMGSLEVKLRNPLYDAFGSIKKGTLQVLYECGICNIFLPRSEVPASWCSSNEGMGSSITFNVPSLPNLKIQALKIYVVFDSIKILYCFIKEYDYITLNNVTKGVKWAYSPLFRCIPRYGMVWLSHWKIGNQLILEAGDEVNVSASKTDFLVKEIGVHVVYEEPEEKGSQHHKAYSRHQNVTNVGDLSAYQLRPGYYHLCHHGNHQDYYQDKNLELQQEERTIFRDFEQYERWRSYEFQDDKVYAL
ncbi:hypothetical protein Vadar_013959 [Vaccinium darrowii]|uniref:Uncharacterized protein n=1 Tax=Vaccinium darrowii TaxID=229202 RepID=A0ACB7Y0D0_9ERIC|nr:hypothetical protein Vadar_013959 [Vaccinium darrowii]